MTGFILLAELVLIAGGVATDQVYLATLAGAALVYLLLAYRHPDLGWMLVWFAVPFSIERVMPGGYALYVPVEPMIVLALLAWTARLQVRGSLRVPRSALHGPLAVLAFLTLLSAGLGRYTGIGAKAWLVAAGYVVFAYLYCFLSRAEPWRNRRWFPWVVGWAAVWGAFGAGRVLLEGLSLKSANAAARPFFTEHGAYAAYLSMFLPLALLLTVEKRGSARMFYAACSLAIGLGVALSLTRAAWVALAVVIPITMGLWAWRHRRLVPVAWLFGLSLVVVAGLQAAGAGRSMTRHAESITATGDVSNLERLNRWMAAVAMVRDRPWTGVGFAAYPETYPEYRRKTIITDLAYQHMGAHSEPMRLLSETGVPGFLAACWFLGTAIFVGLRTFGRTQDPTVMLVSLALVAALGMYAIQAVFRTYLDLEKVTVPLWATLGLLAALGRPGDTAASPAGTLAGASG